MIMLGILTRYFAIQESNYLIDTADDIGKKIAYFIDEDLSDEELNELMAIVSFYVNSQIRLLDADGSVFADSGPPQSITSFTLDKKTDKDAISFSKTIYVGRVNRSPFSSWFFNLQPDDLDGKPAEETEIGRRSEQVVRQAYYDENKQLMGYIELSQGPAFGREILRSILWGWGISAVAAVLLAAAAGTWVSHRFSAPLESLTQITAKMARGDLSSRSDITRQDEFGQLARSFNRMADTIEAKVDALRRFVADAAHELHTPLTALHTNLELVNDKHLEPALEQVERMDALTRGLLDLSELEATAFDKHYEDVDLAALLRNLAEPYASQAEQSGLDFNLIIHSDPAMVRGDQMQLRALIQNLLDNAIKFTPEGGEVRVILSQQDNDVRLLISDTGIGIPEDDLPNLFSRFQRGRNASDYPGSGLGLAIVKTIADQHGADIEVILNPAGTAFEISFSAVP
jgi:signal transduction histidine kinase